MIGILGEKLDVVWFYVDPLAINVTITTFSIQPIDTDLNLGVLVSISAWRPNVDISISQMRFTATWSIATSI
jgi:hypothetical protein